MNPRLWKVAVDAPLMEPLTYRLSEQLMDDPAVVRGTSVQVPLGKRTISGVLLKPAESDGGFRLKDIQALNSNRPVLTDKFLQWLEWLAQYYVHPIGPVVECAFPPLDKQTKERKSRKSPVVPELAGIAAPTLTEEQSAAIRGVQSHPGFGAHLVHGVTGSGKTEIYIHLLEELVAKGGQGLVLVPEISLTPQLIQRFSRRLGNAVAVIHSHLTPREKTNQWWAMVEGERQILIGARSALFCPAPTLGLIILDEEHEASFKQDEKLKYHARDAAVMLGKFMSCPVVLGSATPSLETWNNAAKGRYHLHSLHKRVEDRPMPAIEVIDLRRQRESRKIDDNSSGEAPFWMSDELLAGLTDNLARGEQSALFLNRRGIAQSVFCPACGHVPECPNCAVSLTLHGKNHLLCHYCDFHQTMGSACSECREGEPKPLGLGTELVETDLARLFPTARIARMDRDEIGTREELEQVIDEIERGDVDLIVGTQMIAKGLDFPGLTLVGLVLADIAFNLPDFRSAERSFQLLTQVAGRSGRHVREGAGRVIIQTYDPDHPSITFTQAHDYVGFAQHEMGFREALHYPPFGRLASFRIAGLDAEKTRGVALDLRDRGRELMKRYPDAFSAIELLGPAPAPLAKLRGQHRFQLLTKAPDASTLGHFCRLVLGDLKWVAPAIKLSVDIDAIHLL